jgi:hypothetical protein
MTVHHVNSKHHMLSNKDIILVSAHDHLHSAKNLYKKAGSPSQVTPELFQTALFQKIFDAPNVIRLREGNTLFGIMQDHGKMVCMMFDADTVNNSVKNISTAIKAAKKMGFKTLEVPVENETIRKILKRGADGLAKVKDAKDSLDLEIA